jgi:hypothetical protein
LSLACSSDMLMRQASSMLMAEDLSQ